MNYFIVPLTSQTLGGRTVNAPKYLSTDMAGLGFTCIPYGAEGVAIVALQAANAALSAESDVYTFPENLDAMLADADVTALTNFLTPLNVPTDSITLLGMTWSQVLQLIGTIFLAAQAISGVTGTSLFTAVASPGSGGAGAGMGKTGGQSGGLSAPPTIDTSISDSTASAVVGSIVGPFDLTNVDPSDSIGDVLTSLAAQFTAPVVL
jgi:hypothetical protein